MKTEKKKIRMVGGSYGVLLPKKWVEGLKLHRLSFNLAFALNTIKKKDYCVQITLLACMNACLKNAKKKSSKFS